MKKKQYVYPSMPEVLPECLKGKTTKDVHPRDAMKYFPKRRAWCDAWRYILLSLASEKLGCRTPEYLIDQVRSKILAYLNEVNKDDPQRLKRDLKGFENEVWPELSETMRGNYGMAQMVNDYAYRSRFLPRAILVGAQAVLLELFHSGRTKSVSGDFEYIPYDDAMIEMIVWEPISLVMYERNKFSQQHLLKAYQKFKADGSEGDLEVLFCGAGLLPQLRTNGFPAAQMSLKITAIDMDKRNLTNLKLVYDKDIEEYGVQYLFMDARDYCNDPKNANKYPFVEALGMLSYYRWGGQTEALLRDFLKAVAPGGRLSCDLQLMEPHLLRCAYSMGWKSNLFPDWCAWTAIRRMKKICRKLGVKMKYSRSEYLRHAAGINFVLYKPAMVSHRH